MGISMISTLYDFNFDPRILAQSVRNPQKAAIPRSGRYIILQAVWPMSFKKTPILSLWDHCNYTFKTTGPTNQLNLWEI